MSDENNPSVDEIKAQLETELRTKYESQFNEEKQKILGNRDQILEEKKALEAKLKSFGGVTEDDIKELQEMRQRAEKDELFKLAAAKDIEGLSNKLMAGREKAWNETKEDYENRLKAAQTQASEFEQRALELENRARDMEKHQYLREIVSEDDSFVGMGHFDKFKRLYADRLEIDENGSAWALDEKGVRAVDTDGSHVPFKKLYEKAKINDGLFWRGGSGTGYKGAGGGGEHLGGDPSKWSPEQRHEFITQNGYPAYSELLQKNARKK